MASADDNPEHGASKFGTYWGDLKEAMRGEYFEPLISKGEDGVLHVAVGLVDFEGAEPGVVCEPRFFRPFCGKGLQSSEDVTAKAGAGAELEERQDHRLDPPETPTPRILRKPWQIRSHSSW